MYVKEPDEYQTFSTQQAALEWCIREHILLTNATGRWEATVIPQPDVSKTKRFQHWTVQINDEIYQIIQVGGVFWCWNDTINISSSHDSGRHPIDRTPTTPKTYWIAVRADNPLSTSCGFQTKQGAIDSLNLRALIGGQYRSGCGNNFHLTTFTIQESE